MKNSHRLDYASLAEVLGQKGLVDPQRLKLTLQSSQRGPIPFTESLVADGLIGDWELARVVCEIYGLPFLPVDFYSPSKDVLTGLDFDFLRQHRLAPLARHKRVLTICMPGLVPAEVLAVLASSADVQVMPVVGTVNGNNKWLADNLPAEAPPGSSGDVALDWKNIFDEGDANVLLNLDADPNAGPSQAA